MWKQIEDFDYEINSQGEVRRISNKKVKKSHIRKSGYVSVQLCLDTVKRSFYLHRLLATYFIPNIDNKQFVNHINGIKHDNRLCNLEWVSHYENLRHAFDTGLLFRLSDDKRNEVRDLHKTGNYSYRNLASMFNVSLGTIQSILKE
jgi:hypothetical protein